jgi:hypothetical protein
MKNLTDSIKMCERHSSWNSFRYFQFDEVIQNGDSKQDSFWAVLRASQSGLFRIRPTID